MKTNVNRTAILALISEAEEVIVRTTSLLDRFKLMMDQEDETGQAGDPQNLDAVRMQEPTIEIKQLDIAFEAVNSFAEAWNLCSSS